MARHDALTNPQDVDPDLADLGDDPMQPE
jgi:hypothetical protein